MALGVNLPITVEFDHTIVLILSAQPTPGHPHSVLIMKSPFGVKVEYIWGGFDPSRIHNLVYEIKHIWQEGYSNAPPALVLT